MKKNKANIITVTSTKGGVGKTILTLNLAAVYSDLNYKCLVLDLDLYGGAVATYLNSNNDLTVFNLVEDLIFNRYKDVNYYIYKYSENIDVIAAPKDPRDANKIDSKYIPLLLGSLIHKYDVILIDTHHILDEINLVIMENSDKIIHLITNDVFCLKNAKSFNSIMRDANFKNIVTVLNESFSFRSSYFSTFDIKNIIGSTIDYTISKSFYIDNINKYILDGKILIHNKNLVFRNKKDYSKFVLLAKDLLKEGDD